MIIRPAGQEDAAEIARLHTRSWQNTYRGALPDDYLDNVLGGEFDRHWAQALAAMAGDDVVLMALAGEESLGFIAVWSRTESVRAGFIDNLHVIAPNQGRGIGRRLVAEAASRLHGSGHVMAYLTVLETNLGSVAFYDRMGGTPTDRFVRPVRGYDMPQIRYEWHDLPALAARGG